MGFQTVSYGLRSSLTGAERVTMVPYMQLPQMELNGSSINTLSWLKAVAFWKWSAAEAFDCSPNISTECFQVIQLKKKRNNFKTFLKISFNILNKYFLSYLCNQKYFTEKNWFKQNQNHTNKTLIFLFELSSSVFGFLVTGGMRLSNWDGKIVPLAAPLLFMW